MPRITDISFRKGTAAEWAASNPILNSGEPGYDTTNKLFKIGDGVTSWSNLNYLSTNTSITRGSFTPSTTQSTFTVNNGYVVGSLDVFYNGVKLLSNTDYAATNGSSFTLTNPAVNGDVVEYLAFSAVSINPNAVRASVNASAGQTAFDVSGGYTIGNLDVFLNGIKLLNGIDFIATNGSSITLTAAAAIGDVLEYIAYGLVVASNGLQKTGDTMTGNLTIGTGNQIVFSSSIIDTNSLDISICNGRLTLENGVAISTTDQTAKTTLYFTPYNGNRICLYDTILSKWKMYSFNELSLSLAGLAADTNYDIYMYDNNGILTLESTSWTNDTTRATALTTQDGIYVKTGSSNRRYLGTMRTTSTIGQCEDSTSRRFLWNMYNKVYKQLYSSLLGVSHTYTSTTTRAWNNNTTVGQGRVLFVLGLIDSIFGGFLVSQQNAASTGLGLDSTTATINNTLVIANQNTSAVRGSALATINNVSAGYHYLQLIENSTNGTSGSYNTGAIDSQILC